MALATNDPTNRTTNNGFRLALKSVRGARDGPEVPDGTDRIPDRPDANSTGGDGNRDVTGRVPGTPYSIMSGVGYRVPGTRPTACPRRFRRACRNRSIR